MAVDHPQHVFCFPTRFFRVPERILLQITTRRIKLNGGIIHDPFLSNQLSSTIKRRPAADENHDAITPMQLWLG
jgi:hypothetical protein